MKNISILIVSLLFSMHLIAQQGYTLLEEYKLRDYDIVFSVGDSIGIGEFRHESYNIYIPEKINNKWGYKNIGDDYVNTRGKIVRIYSNGSSASTYFRFRGKVVFEVQIADKMNAFILIEDALERDEVVVFPHKTFKDISIGDTTLLVTEIGLKELNDEEALFYYLYKFDQRRYAAYKNDEFLFRKEKEDALKELKGVIARNEIKKFDTVQIILRANFSEYNFDDSTFSIYKGQTDLNWMGRDFYSNKTGVLHFTNFDDYTAIKSLPSNAEFFVKRRNSFNFYSPGKGAAEGVKKTRTGIVVVTAILEDIQTYEKYNTQSYQFDLKIIDLVAVDNEKGYYNYIGKVK